jgi:hypothetical protein
MEAIQYKGYTIESSLSPFGGFEYFPTKQGRDDDYDVVDGDYKYCGNVRHADTLEEAKDEISEKIMTSLPAHKVATQNGKNITKFWWLSEAVDFAVKFKGDLFIGSPTSDHYPIESI